MTQTLAVPRAPWRVLLANPIFWSGLLGYLLLNLAVIRLSHGYLPFDRPAMIGKSFAYQLAVPTLGLIEQFALMGLVWLLTRKRAIVDMAARAPGWARSLGETVGLLIYAALGLLGGYVVGPAFGYRPFGFHLAGSMVGCSVLATPGETALWASYNFIVFAVIPYLWFRRRYSALNLNLVSTNRLNDAIVIVVVLIVESAVQLAAMPGVFAMTLPNFLKAAPISFAVFFVGTVLPTMVLIYAILLPRYMRLTGSVMASVILGGVTYAAMHLVEGWSTFGNTHDAALSMSFALLSYVGPGMFKSYITVRTGNAWSHVWAYHAIAPHVIVDTPMIAKVFGIV